MNSTKHFKIYTKKRVNFFQGRKNFLSGKKFFSSLKEIHSFQGENIDATWFGFTAVFAGDKNLFISFIHSNTSSSVKLCPK